MRIDAKEIMDIVREFLGKHCDGLYIQHFDYREVDDEEDDSSYRGDNFDEDYPSTIMTIFDDADPEFIDYDNIPYQCQTGASKLVIMPKDKDYVIKLPFTNTYDIMKDGTYKVYSKTTYDICEYENQIRDEASEEVKKILVPNTYIGAYNGTIPVYIQKKIDKTCEDYFNEEDFKPMQGSLSKLFNYFHTHFMICCCINDIFLAPYVHKLGIKKFKDFCKELGGINDLHDQNWGVFKDMTIGIIDYGGYDYDTLFEPID